MVFKYNNDLPIVDYKKEIISVLKESQVLVIAGETGSGKTTQLPKFLLEAGYGSNGLIGCTQPRRIAAISVAERISDELEESPGETIGYQIRFQDNISKKTRVKLMTDGVLLAETQQDPFLSKYEVLIIDEAHERSLNIDFLLGILRTLLDKRKDLKVLITSATIDTEKFSKAFNNAPILEVSGRLFPVEVCYRPLEGEDQTPVEKSVEICEELVRESSSGDILIFMPSEQYINDTCDLIHKRLSGFGLTVLPLFARLPSHEQQKIFKSSGGRKVIVSTNIAETSLTVPGIKYVIDSGLARILHYNPSSGTYGLPIEPVSKSSADQRKGRCGRVESGICYRLFEEEDFLHRKMFTLPEIQRTNLADVLLRMLKLRIQDIHSFPFIDKPSRQGIADAFKTLKELGAVKKAKTKDDKKVYRLTKTGHAMAGFPLDPRLSRILLAAEKEEVLGPVLVIIAALSIQDPRSFSAEDKDKAREAQKIYADDRSDFMFYLNLWDVFQKNKASGALKKLCKSGYLSYRRMREWQDIYNQLLDMVKKQKMNLNTMAKDNEESFYRSIHTALLSGFLSHIARKKEGRQFTAARGREAMIFPGSYQFDSPPEWIVALEYVQTSRLFARTVGFVDPKWIQHAANHLIEREPIQPRWNRQSGRVEAFEKVKLFGLILSNDRIIPYGKYRPEEATEIFIRDALVEGNIANSGHYRFLRENRKTMALLEKQEDKLRVRGFRISNEELFQLYRERISEVFDLGGLQKLLKQKGDDFLTFSMDEMRALFPDSSSLEAFPDSVSFKKASFKLEYSFNPGDSADGVTLKAPLKDLDKIDAVELDKAVPGLLKERITAYLKGLPKKLRKQLIPVSSTAEKIVPLVQDLDMDLRRALFKVLREEYRIDLSLDDLDDDKIPEHLKVRLEIYNQQGKLVNSGRDKGLLFSGYKDSVNSDILNKLRKKYEETYKGSPWYRGDIPDTIEHKDRNGKLWKIYAGIAEDEGVFSFRLYTDKNLALEKHKHAILALAKQDLKKELRGFKEMLVFSEEARKALLYLGAEKKISQYLWDNLMRFFFLKNIRSEKEFQKLLSDLRPEIYTTADKWFKQAETLLVQYKVAREDLTRMLKRAEKFQEPYLNERLQELIDILSPEFFRDTDREYWEIIERIIRGLVERCRKALWDLSKDREKSLDLLPLRETLQKLSDQEQQSSPERRREITKIRWKFREFESLYFSGKVAGKKGISLSKMKKELEQIEFMV